MAVSADPTWETMMSPQKALDRLAAVLGQARTLDDDNNNLPVQTLHILICIAQTPGLTMQQICARTDLSLSAVNRQVAKTLGPTKLDLVETTEDPHESRRKIAFLTPKGRTFVRNLLNLQLDGDAASWGPRRDLNPHAF